MLSRRSPNVHVAVHIRFHFQFICSAQEFLSFSRLSAPSLSSFFTSLPLPLFYFFSAWPNRICRFNEAHQISCKKCAETRATLTNIFSRFLAWKKGEGGVARPAGSCHVLIILIWHFLPTPKTKRNETSLKNCQRAKRNPRETNESWQKQHVALISKGEGWVNRGGKGRWEAALLLCQLTVAAASAFPPPPIPLAYFMLRRRVRIFIKKWQI